MTSPDAKALAICAWCKRDTDFTLGKLPRACNHCGVILARPVEDWDVRKLIEKAQHLGYRVDIKLVDQESP